MLTRMQDFFTYYIRQQTILADITVGCQSNGRRVSSIFDLLAPATKSSTGGTACSRLPWPAVLPRRPHRPLLLPPLARPSLYSPTPPVILRRRQPHTAANQWTLILLYTWASTAAYSRAPHCPLPRPRHRPPPWCSRRGVANMVKERLPSDMDCTWRG